MMNSLAKLEPYADEWDYDDFVCDIDSYFNQYLGKEVFVRGVNLNWRGQNGVKTFVLEETEQVFKELVHENTDYSFDISRTRGRNTYKARSSNHDCPTGSYFVLSFREVSENE
tara:strand:- start:5338 stop:5676 length:339 start_codon:yes stop_codon:yes gene_type:complete